MSPDKKFDSDEFPIYVPEKNPGRPAPVPPPPTPAPKPAPAPAPASTPFSFFHKADPVPPSAAPSPPFPSGPTDPVTAPKPAAPSPAPKVPAPPVPEKTSGWTREELLHNMKYGPALIGQAMYDACRALEKTPGSLTLGPALLDVDYLSPEAVEWRKTHGPDSHLPPKQGGTK